MKSRYRNSVASALGSLLLLLLGCSGSGGSSPGVDTKLELAYVPSASSISASASLLPEGFHAVGTNIPYTGERAFMLAVAEGEPGALAAPVDYTERALQGGTAQEAWEPIAPDGYACLGVIVTQGGSAKPETEALRCVRQDLLAPARAGREVQPGLFEVLPADASGVYLGSLAYLPDGAAGAALKTIAARTVRSASGTLTQEVVDSWVEKYGPKVGMSMVTGAWSTLPAFPTGIGPIFQKEIHLPDDPVWVLDHQAYVVDGQSGRTKTSASSLVADAAGVPQPTHLELDLGQRGDDSPGPNGDMARARAIVRISPWNAVFTDLQFWLYYPFNGDPPVRARCGDLDYLFQATPYRHFSDWENVTIRIENRTGAIAAISLSQHAANAWVEPDGLQKDGQHPLVHAGYHSHANYATEDLLLADLKDISLGWPITLCNVNIDYVTFAAFDPSPTQTTTDRWFRTWLPEHHQVVSASLPGYQITTPDWLLYPESWGRTLVDSAGINFDFGIVSYYLQFVGSTDAGTSSPAIRAEWRDGPPGHGYWGPELKNE